MAGARPHSKADSRPENGIPSPSAGRGTGGALWPPGGKEETQSPVNVVARMVTTLLLVPVLQCSRIEQMLRQEIGFGPRHPRLELDSDEVANLAELAISNGPT